MTDDHAVIRRVLGGAVDEFRWLVERHQASILRLVHNLLDDRHEAEDLAQEVFLAAFDRLASFDETKARFSTWLHAIARNCCHRRHTRRIPKPEDDLPEPANTRSPGTALDEAEFFSRLDGALARLRFEERAVFVLAELEQRSHDEIAEIEGIACGTVKSRLSRAREKLRLWLEDPVEGRR